MDHLLQQLSELSPTQLIALVTGIIYVILASRERALCWVFGIISCALIAWDDFTAFRLYADGVLQLLYVGLGFYGLYQWQFGSGTGHKLRVHSLRVKNHVVIIGVAALLSIPIAWALRSYTDAAFSYLDTLTTVLSICATWLLVQKVLENWLYWIMIDAVYVYLFFERGGVLIAVLYAVYLLVAIYGFIHWRRQLNSNAVVEI